MEGMTTEKPSRTCQVCERACKVVHGRVSLHGYKRPGHGEINGKCPGAKHLSWEESCEALRAYVGELVHQREAAGVRLAAVRDPALTEITEYVITLYPQKSWNKTYKRGERDDRGCDMFAIVQSNRIRKFEAEISLLGHEIARQEKRLAGWKGGCL